MIDGKKRILIVEDDENITRLEKDYLEANGFNISTAGDGLIGLEMARANNYNLIILDIMLPGIDGMEICQRIRKFSDIPIIFVSAKRDDLDKIKGLGFGADDYIVKPFSPSELVARVIAHINRYERLTTLAAGQKSNIIEIDSLKIDKQSRRVFFENQEITFTNKEFDLLAMLAQSPDTVFNKNELLNKIWKYDSNGDTSTVTVHINRVREKLFAVDNNMELINTVWGKAENPVSAKAEAGFLSNQKAMFTNRTLLLLKILNQFKSRNSSDTTFFDRSVKYSTVAPLCACFAASSSV